MREFGLEFRRNAAGRWRAGVPARLQISDWRRTAADERSMTYRPSARTLVRRLGATLIAAIFLVLLFWTCGTPWQAPPPPPAAPLDPARQEQQLRELKESLKQRLSPEAWARIERETAEKQRQREIDRAAAQLQHDRWATIGRAARWIATGLLLAAGLLPPLVLPLERVTIERGPDDELIVRSARFRTKEQSWPRGTFAQIRCEARETIRRRRRPRRLVHYGWFWVVRFVPIRAGVSPGEMSRFPDFSSPEFCVGHEPTRPLDAHRPPKRVRSFVKRLQALSSVSDVQYDLVATREVGGRLRTDPVVAGVMVSEPIVEESTTTYGSLDEMPAELRRRVEQMMASGETSHESTRIVIRAADGTETVYKSVEEMPDDVREQYRLAMRTARNKRRSDS